MRKSATSVFKLVGAFDQELRNTSWCVMQRHACALIPRPYRGERRWLWRGCVTRRKEMKAAR